MWTLLAQLEWHLKIPKHIRKEIEEGEGEGTFDPPYFHVIEESTKTWQNWNFPESFWDGCPKNGIIVVVHSHYADMFRKFWDDPGYDWFEEFTLMPLPEGHPFCYQIRKT